MIDEPSTKLLHAFFAHLTLRRKYGDATANQYRSMIRAAMKRATKAGLSLTDYFAQIEPDEKARIGYALNAWDLFMTSIRTPPNDNAQRLTAELSTFLQAYEAGLTNGGGAVGLETVPFVTPRVSWALWQLGYVWIQPWLNTPWNTSRRNAFGPPPREVWRNKGFEATIPGIISGLDWRSVHFEGGARIDDLILRGEFKNLDTPMQQMFSVLWQAGGWEGVPHTQPRPIAPREARSPYALSAGQISLGMNQHQFRRDDALPDE